MTLQKVSSDWDALVNALQVQSEKVAQTIDMLKIAHVSSELLQTSRMQNFKEGVAVLICIGILLRNSL